MSRTTAELASQVGAVQEGFARELARQQAQINAITEELQSTRQALARMAMYLDVARGDIGTLLDAAEEGAERVLQVREGLALLGNRLERLQGELNAYRHQ